MLEELTGKRYKATRIRIGETLDLAAQYVYEGVDPLSRRFLLLFYSSSFASLLT